MAEKTKAQLEAELAEKEEQLAAALARAEAAETEASEAPAAPAQKHPVPDPEAELVPIRLFKDNGKYKDDVFVAVNGKSVLIKRGETVMVKRMFADILEQSMAQDAATASLIERETAAYDAQAKRLGI